MTTDETPGAVPDQFTIVKVPESGRYELRDGGTTIGFAEYRDRQARGAHPARLFTHTEVDGAYEGRGFGSRLARHVVDDTVREGRRVVPFCPFIGAWLRRHHEFDASVDWPDAAGGAEDGTGGGAPA